MTGPPMMKNWSLPPSAAPKAKSSWVGVAVKSDPTRSARELLPLAGPSRSTGGFVPSFKVRFQLTMSAMSRVPMVPLVVMKPVAEPAPTVSSTAYVMSAFAAVGKRAAANAKVTNHIDVRIMEVLLAGGLLLVAVILPPVERAARQFYFVNRRLNMLIPANPRPIIGKVPGSGTVVPDPPPPPLPPGPDSAMEVLMPKMRSL